MPNYSGVREDVIRNALPEMIEGRLELFTHYINEREAVRKAKETLMPFPWTDDPIIRDYRFTNVRRTDDTVSKWYIENIATNNDLSLYDKIANAILFRCWNKPETSVMFQQPITDWSDDNLYEIEILANVKIGRAGDNYRQYGSAYFQSGLKGAWKKEGYSATRMLDLMKSVVEDCVIEKILYNNNPMFVFETINAINGIGSFLAYQMWVDLTYIPEYDLNEDDFTVAGPGCRLGIDMLVEDRDGMTHEEVIFHIRDNQHALDLDIDFQLTVMDIENIFCEYSKYTKRYLGQSNRMRNYKPNLNGELL